MSDKLKKYSEFMPQRRYNKVSNQVFIDGQLRGNLLVRPATFSLVVSYTPLKKIIINISIEGVDIKDDRLSIDFKIGDNIDKAVSWAKSKGFEYHTINRFN